HPIVSVASLFLYLCLPRPPRSTLFPYTTLFRSTIPHDQVSYIAKNVNVKYAIVEDEEQYNKLIEADVPLEKIIMMFPKNTEMNDYIPFQRVESIGEKNNQDNWEDL